LLHVERLAHLPGAGGDTVSARGGLLGVLVLIPLACTTQSSNNPYMPSTGGGGVGGGAVMPTGSVTVMITGPSDNTTIFGSSTITVTATVDDSGSDLIDTSSVKMTLAPIPMGATMPTPGTAPVASGQLVFTGGDNYSGTLNIGALAPGSYALVATAQSATGAKGTSPQVTLLLQGGPTLIVNAPTEGQSYNGSVSIEILVDPNAPAPSAVLAGMNVTLSGPTRNGNYDVYTATVTFGPVVPPPTVNGFPALSGPQLLDVKETANGATSEVLRIFVIDTQGPTITLTTPAPGVVVGGVQIISATITDESGVLDSSVEAVIGNQQGDPIFTLQLMPQGSGIYATLFDTANLTPCVPGSGLCEVYPTVSFRASDTVGNESSLGYEFSIDNIPPVADLDPPPMRQMQLVAFGYECSALFDPLSRNTSVGDMPNDNCTVPQLFDLRARVEDDGNHAVGLKIGPIAGIDPANTSVYIVPENPSEPIPVAVDTDGDGNCDAINPLLAPTMGPLTQSNQILKVRLAGVPPGGSADFEGKTADPGLPIPGVCQQGIDPAPPKSLCQLAGLLEPTIAIGYADNSPAIWSVEPIDADRCFGNQFDTYANNIPDKSWICIVVGSADLAGNHSVSAPIRVWVDYNDPGGFCAAPPASAGAPPPCTGRYDPVSKTAAIGSCNARKFGSGELYCAPGAC
jgi:hypothetical protein